LVIRSVALEFAQNFSHEVDKRSREQSQEEFHIVKGLLPALGGRGSRSHFPERTLWTWCDEFLDM